LVRASAQAADYAALEGKEFYAGGILVFFWGDGPSGDSASESLLGVSGGGLSDRLAWQGFLACSWDGDSTMLGGNVDAVLADNFESCSTEEADGLWWLGAGGSLIAYQSVFAEASGTSVDGEELGINVGGGYFWSSFTGNFYLHLFPDSSNTMLTASVMRQF
jgi:hypothetical protein